MLRESTKITKKKKIKMQVVLADVVLDFPQTGEKMPTHKHMDAKTYERKAAIHICSFSKCQN